MAALSATAWTGIAYAADAGQNDVPGAVDAVQESGATAERSDSQSSGETDNDAASEEDAQADGGGRVDDGTAEEDSESQPDVAAEVESSSDSSSDTPAEASSTSSARTRVNLLAADNDTETVLYLEDFENDMSSKSLPVMLGSYTGDQNATSGMKYTADQYWLEAKYCNGFVMNANMFVSKTRINTTYCGPNGGNANSVQSEDDYGAVRTKAYALGRLNRESMEKAKTNNALSTNTSGGSVSTLKDNQVMFKTATNIKLTGSSAVTGRFLIFSVDVAAQCGGTQKSPELWFSMVQGSTTHVMNKSAISVCNLNSQFRTDDASLNRVGDDNDNHGAYADWVYGKIGNNTGVIAGHYYGDTAIKMTSNDSFSIVLKNTSDGSSTGKGAGGESGSFNGNDSAIDNIRVIDGTPTLNKSFSPMSVSIGRESTLTLEIDNTKDLATKAGWSFVDTLPAGLQLSPDQTASGTCLGLGRSTKVVLDYQNNKVTVTDGQLNHDESSCSIQVKVTSTQEGTYVNKQVGEVVEGETANVTDMGYILPGHGASVAFYAGSLGWSKVDAAGNELSGSEWRLEGPSASTVSTPNGGWPVGAIVDCVNTDESACTGLDKDPIAGKFKVTGLPSGTYTLTENKAPTGYVALTDPLTATITGAAHNASFGTGGKITNTVIVGNVVWKKQDAGGNALSGSEWRILDSNNTVVAAVTDCTADGDCSGTHDSDAAAGSFKYAGLPYGKYQLVETKAPVGYVLDTTPHSFEITQNGIDFTADGSPFLNTQAEVPTLPLTGGMSTDAFLLGGGGLLALAGLGGFIHRRRSLRVAKA